MTTPFVSKFSERITTEITEGRTRVFVRPDNDERLFGVFVSLGCIYSLYLAVLTLCSVWMQLTGIASIGAVLFVFSFSFIVTILLFGGLCYVFGSEVISITQDKLTVEIQLASMNVGKGRSFDANAISNMRVGERLVRRKNKAPTRKPIIVFDYKNGIHEFFSRFGPKERAYLFAGSFSRFVAKNK